MPVFKKKAGPPLKKGPKRTQRLACVVTPAEEKAVRKMCRDKNATVSDFLRELVTERLKVAGFATK